MCHKEMKLKKKRKWAILQTQLVEDSVNESPDFEPNRMIMHQSTGGAGGGADFGSEPSCQTSNS